MVGAAGLELELGRWMVTLSPISDRGRGDEGIRTTNTVLNRYGRCRAPTPVHEKETVPVESHRNPYHSSAQPLNTDISIELSLTHRVRTTFLGLSWTGVLAGVNATGRT